MTEDKSKLWEEVGHIEFCNFVQPCAITRDTNIKNLINCEWEGQIIAKEFQGPEMGEGFYLIRADQL